MTAIENFTVKGPNATQVEYSDFQQNTLGRFIQSAPSAWLEQNTDKLTTFSFQESYRDEWSVYLFDPSRNVNIAIDLHLNQVKYRDLSSPDYRKLYAINGASSAPAPYIFSSLKYYNNWYYGGGEQRGGLPLNSMLNLNNLVVNFRGSLNQIVSDLQTMKSNWLRIESSQSGMTNALLSKFVPDLASMVSQANALVTQASHGTVLVEEANTIVKAHILEDQTQQAQAIADRDRAKEGMRVAKIQLEAAKAELRGSKGFLNGFLTGVTFSAYNPIKENIDKQNKAINSYNVNLINANNSINTLQRAQNELIEEQKTLSQLTFMSTAFVYFQNHLSNAENSLSIGHDEAEKAIATSNNRLGAYYREKAGKEMRQLFGWIDSFTAAN
jgi:hypothetical protein